MQICRKCKTSVMVSRVFNAVNAMTAILNFPMNVVIGIIGMTINGDYNDTANCYTQW